MISQNNMEAYKEILPTGYCITGNRKYEVWLFIKQGRNAETYRVKADDGKLYFLKLFNYARIPRSAFDEENNLLEIEFLKTIKHPNLVSFADNGELIFDERKYPFLILDFIVGETLTERISREPFRTLYDVKQCISGVLNGLIYLHSLPDPIIHNEITPQNVMLDLSGNIPYARIIDFGNARSFHQSVKAFNKDGLNLNYVAPESFNGLYSPQSDLFSVGALMYYLIFGLPPWFKDFSQFQTDRNKIEDLILEQRRTPLSFPDVSGRIVDFDASIVNVIKKALLPDPESRFQSANEFLQALNGEIEVDDEDILQRITSHDNVKKAVQPQKAKGKGFDAIVGMKELKELLRVDVIDALHNPAKYAEYKITIPNGMLLYGPPGCGKTFFAKHFAEEVGFNFMIMTPSSLKSRYVNATQENIAKMFEEAEKNAPTIIFIDEINELLPNRDSDVHEMSRSAVNEMLAQMDRTGEQGIFIIGATNYPDMIDPAMLRAGRLDKKFYVPPPDFEARRGLFEMYLKNRPLDFGIDYDKLANLTENYVSSDIAFLVNEASRAALQATQRITMNILEATIASTKPSVKIQELQKFEKIKATIDLENIEQKKARPRIGFIRDEKEDK